MGQEEKRVLEKRNKLEHGGRGTNGSELLFDQQGADMKKLLLSIIPVFLVMCYVLSVMPSKVSAENAFKLSGTVRYSDGEWVGSGKPVYVYDTPTHYMVCVYTNAASEYSWSFYPPHYVYKVHCHFTVDQEVYSGESIIDDTLYH